MEVAQKIPPITLRLASQLGKCQELQETIMWRYIQQYMNPLPEIADCVLTAAHAIIDRATFTIQSSALTKLRHIIVGPAKSGKSTFLQLLTNLLLERFWATGQYRQTLVIYFDMRKCIPCNGSLFELYNEIVKTTFKHLAAQRLDLIPYTKVLVSYFVGLYHTSSFIPLPSPFAGQDYLQALAPALNTIAERIPDSLYLNRNLNL
jgi:hypothetical protein